MTILLLMSFLVSQYARQFYYWECRASNYFKSDSEKCDCEALIKQTNNQDNAIPAIHTHLHLDESFYPPSSAAEDIVLTIQLQPANPVCSVFFHTNNGDRLDRPPQAK